MDGESIQIWLGLVFDRVLGRILRYCRTFGYVFQEQIAEKKMGIMDTGGFIPANRRIRCVVRIAHTVCKSNRMGFGYI